MRFSALSLPFLVASLPVASGQLHFWAKKAGLKYFGAATDSPGQRERAGYEASYAQYASIFADNGEFGQTTPTNGQKWLFTEPERGVFNFTEGEIVTSLARSQGKILRCHALVWHSQLAPWVESQNWTAAEITDIITTHITNVMGHWKGQCYAWDVVNEALLDDGTWRPSPFYNALGPDFIKLAFRVASETDPDAKLYYNDYNLESPGVKATAAVGIVQMLKHAGIRVDGIGMQAHLVAGDSPSLGQQVQVIKQYAAAGVEVALTELDVRIELPLNETNLQQQKQAYHDAVAACVQVDACVGVTIWDFYDPFSWVPATFPGQGEPLLWFANFTRHPAYYGALEALSEGTNTTCWRRGRRT